MTDKQLLNSIFERVEEMLPKDYLCAVFVMKGEHGELAYLGNMQIEDLYEALKKTIEEGNAEEAQTH